MKKGLLTIAALCFAGVVLLPSLAFSASSADLVLHYTFDQDSELIAVDSSNYTNNGIIFGAVPVAGGVSGSALRFDGVDDYIRVPHSASLEPEEITISTWVKMHEFNENFGSLAFKRNTSFHNNEVFDVLILHDGTVQFVLANGVQTVLNSTSPIDLETWHHMAVVFAQPDMKIYIDGALVAAAPHNYALNHNSDTDLLIGARDHAEYPMESFPNCDIDEFQIYRAALSPTEIAALAGVEVEGEGDLILHYTFDQDSELIATDSSSYGNDGIINGATLVEDGVFGTVLRLDGVDDYIRVPRSASLEPEEITISTWVKMHEFNENFGLLVHKRNPSFHNNEDYDLQIWNEGTVRSVLANGAQSRLDSSSPLELEIWHHVAMVFSQPDLKLYIDGVLVGTKSHNYPLSHNPKADLLIGATDHAYYPMDLFLNCDIDELQIYKTALSGTEISELAGVNTGGEGDLVLHFTFDNDSDSLTTDSSSYGNHGIIHGTIPVAGGVSGSAMRFDGADDYIRVPRDPSLEPDEITVATWVKMHEFNGNFGSLAFKRNTSFHNNEEFDVLILHDGTVQFVLANGVQTVLNSSSPIGLETWHHVAVVFAQPNMKIYIDGALVAAAPHNHALKHNSDTDLLIGARDHAEYPLESFPNCDLDELKIYKTALSGAEIAELAMPPAPPPGELVLHYTFDQDSGMIATDSSGYANNGVVHGATPISSDILGSAMHFDGIDDYIQVPSSESLMPDEVTVSAWVKMDSFPENYALLVHKRNTSLHNNEDYVIQITPAGSARFVMANSGAQTYMDSAPLTVGQWHHVAATFSQPDMKIYVNGVLANSAHHDHPMAHNEDADIFIGASDHLTYPMESFAHGSYDEVRIYNIALSDAEIAELATPPPPPPGELVLHYTFDQDSGTITTDSSGYANNGVVHGATPISSDILGSAMHFDGIDDYIQVPSSESLMPDEVTVSAWVKMDSFPENYALLVHKRNTSLHNNEDYVIQITPAGSARFVMANSGAQTYMDSAPLTVGQWHHVAATFSQPDMKIYVDGILANSAHHDYPMAHNEAADVFIGASDHLTYPMESFAHAVLDEVRIYNTVLSAAEIEELAEDVMPVEYVSLGISGNPDDLGYPLPFGYGSDQFLPGSPISVSADLFVPVTDTSRFRCTGWTGTGSVPSNGSTHSLVFSITENSTLTWQFQKQYLLMLQASSNAQIVGASGWVDEGETVSLSATVAPHYHFAGWSGDIPPDQVMDMPLVLTMDQARSVSVTVAHDAFDVSGRIYYSGPQVGPIRVLAFSSEDAPASAASTSLLAPGNYSLPNLSIENKYWIRSYLDSNENQQQDSWEPVGSYLFNPVDGSLGKVNHANIFLVRLSPPTNILARPSTMGIVLSWDASEESAVVGYNIYRFDHESGQFSKLNTAPIGDLDYLDMFVHNGVTYYYYLTAVSYSGFGGGYIESSASDIVTSQTGQVTLWMSDYIGAAGSDVRLRINLTDAKGILGDEMSICVNYDPSLLTPVSLLDSSRETVEVTALTRDLAVSSLIETGQVTIVATGSSPGNNAVLHVLGCNYGKNNNWPYPIKVMFKSLNAAEWSFVNGYQNVNDGQGYSANIGDIGNPTNLMVHVLDVDEDTGYESDSGSAFIRMYRNGDSLADIPAVENADHLSRYLDGLVDTNLLVTIGENDALYLFELNGSATGDLANFQDVMLYVEFTQGATLNGVGHIFDVLFNVNPTATNGETAWHTFGDVVLKDKDGTLLSIISSNKASFVVGSAYVLGDVNGDGIVDHADFHLAQQIALGKVECTPEQLLAGDIDGDGVITMKDATMIIRLEHGWALNPGGNLLQSPNRARDASSDSIGHVVSLGDCLGQPNEMISVPILIDNMTDIASIDVRVTFNSHLLTLSDVILGPLTMGWELDHNAGDGYVDIGLFNDLPLSSGSGIVAYVEFVMNSNAAVGVFSDMSIADSEFGDEYGSDITLLSGVDHTDGAVWVTFGNVDSDGDGLSDLEEQAFDGSYLWNPYHPVSNPSGSDPDVNNPDTDGDGMWDGDEQRAGTSPVDPHELLALRNLEWQSVSEGVFKVTWESVPGKIYTILWASNLTSEFSVLESDVLASDGVCSRTQQVDGAISGFYIIRLQE